MGSPCGGAHEISGIPTPLCLCGWVVGGFIGRWVGQWVVVGWVGLWVVVWVVMVWVVVGLVVAGEGWVGG